MEHAIDTETFEKARRYSVDRENFGIFKGLFVDVLITVLQLYFGVLAFFWRQAENIVDYVGLDRSNEILVTCAFLAILIAEGFVKDMPFKIYSTFVLEERHGFNKQTVGFFIKDNIKSLILNVLISMPIISCIIYIVQVGGDYFFVWLWVFISVIMLVLMTIYPVFIAPIFDKFRPLDDGPLRKSIESLAASVNFPLTQLYVVEGSRRSAHSNAYFYGMFGSKRIVLFDTLLKPKEEEKDNAGEKHEETELTKDETKNDQKPKDKKGCEDNEILAILAHELGHWAHSHMVKNIIIAQGHLFLIFVVFSKLFHFGPLYQSVGFDDGVKPIFIGLVLIGNYVLTAYNALISFGMTVLSRKFEYQADAYAMKLGHHEGLKSGLIKLNIDNLGFPVHDWLYSAMNHSHPTLLQRLSHLSEDQKKDN